MDSNQNAPVIESVPSDLFKEIVGSKRYSNWEAFAEDFNTYQKVSKFQANFKAGVILNIFLQISGSVFRVKSSTSIEVENKKRKTPIPQQFQYANVHFCCVHFWWQLRRCLEKEFDRKKAEVKVSHSRIKETPGISSSAFLRFIYTLKLQHNYAH